MFSNKKIFFLIFCLVINKSIYSVGVYTGQDFLRACEGKEYIQNLEICNTAIAQAFSAYMVSIELFGGEELAKCYRNYYPFLERKSVKDGVEFLSEQYKKNPKLIQQLVGFGFSVVMYSSYPIPSKC
ncbi:hypothetical protein FOLKNPGA_01241 [Legionella sp. PC1000]|uniref:hypothetical protein n=1 Tax=Legionella sp. PC1000 TaxID=2746060 RepID=UPI0015FE1CDE|nr:hypothetical protein [Legionella sp. PC1000]QLZ68462.1 hypothetical protein FOLKNPGA_01241 [Legionella sp. PC1000]